MDHLVRCRGGKWRLARDGEGLKIFRKRSEWPADAKAFGKRKMFRPYWNGTVRYWDLHNTRDSWGERPTWLPAAYLSCEADPAEGPKHAAAILDSDPGDDTPALIACDWLEGLGLEGRFEVEFREREQAITFASDPLPDWQLASLGQIHPKTGNAVVEGRGPLASWCRHLVVTRCVACGGRRDGEDLVEAGQAAMIANEMFPGSFRQWDQVTVKRAAGSFALPDGRRIILETRCQLCRHFAQSNPPALAIPEVMR